MIKFDNKKNFLLSIIIPCYNGEKHIKRCIDSILNQTYQNFEIIVINDGSTDNSLKILNDYTDNCIKIISQENKGVGETRNVGITNAKGDYIMFVDVDDWLEKYSIENYIQILKDGDFDIIIGGYKTFDGKEYKKIDIKEDTFDLYNHTEPWNRIYKTSFLKNNNILYKDLRSNEDFIFCVECYSKSNDIKIIEDSGYVYNIANNTSITKTIHKHFFDDFGKALKYACKIEKGQTKNKLIIQYKIIKSVIVYLLYSGKYETSNNFINEYKKHFGFIRSKFNIYIGNFIFKESVQYNLLIRGFLLLDKLHLIPLFAKLYCKGK